MAVADLTALPERIVAKIDAAAWDAGDDSACWIWTASLNTTGYGQAFHILDGRRNWLAHRLVWRLLVGDPPAHLHHTCHTPRCVRPDHLQPLVSNAEHRAVHAAERATCVNGHEWTPENTAHRAGGGRICRRCKADRERARRAGLTPGERAAEDQRNIARRRARTGARKRAGSRY